MVLQRHVPLPIWGTSEPHEKIHVALDDNTANTKADAGGKWRVTLKPMKADGKAHKLTVRGTTTAARPKSAIVLEDILIGEVWVGSGSRTPIGPMQVAILLWVDDPDGPRRLRGHHKLTHRVSRSSLILPVREVNRESLPK